MIISIPKVVSLALLVATLSCRENLEPTTAAEPETTVDMTLARAPAFAQVSAGTEHTCGVTTAYVAYCWGNNELGQLGNRSSTGPEICGELDVPCSTRPVRVMPGLKFREVSAGTFHTCGLTARHVAYCWGFSAGGTLGNGSLTGPEMCFRFGVEVPCSTSPVRVKGRLAFRSLSLGNGHTCGVTTSYALYCWGGNEFGQLGIGTRRGPETCVGTLGGDDETPVYTPCSSRPVRIASGLSFRQVSAGRYHTCGVTTNHRAYCWGGSFFGQLGNRTTAGPEICGTHAPCSRKPVRVAGGLAFRQVSAGDDHTCGVTTEDITFCWGANEGGQLGRGTSTGPEECPQSGEGYCSSRPVRVVGRLLFERVDGGGRSTCGLSRSDTLYCWGENWLGMLGIGTIMGPETCSVRPCSTSPLRVKGALVFRQVSAGALHTCGVTTSSVAYCWGSNNYGELGTGTSRGPENCLDPCSTRPVAVAHPVRH
jgi:alpha-tubulin suppressor-like RCC1 family protein